MTTNGMSDPQTFTMPITMTEEQWAGLNRLSFEKGTTVQNIASKFLAQAIDNDALDQTIEQLSSLTDDLAAVRADDDLSRNVRLSVHDLEVLRHAIAVLRTCKALEAISDDDRLRASPATTPGDEQ